MISFKNQRDDFIEKVGEKRCKFVALLPASNTSCHNGTCLRLKNWFVLKRQVNLFRLDSFTKKLSSLIKFCADLIMKILCIWHYSCWDGREKSFKFKTLFWHKLRKNIFHLPNDCAVKTQTWKKEIQSFFKGIFRRKRMEADEHLPITVSWCHSVTLSLWFIQIEIFREYWIVGKWI